MDDPVLSGHDHLMDGSGQSEALDAFADAVRLWRLRPTPWMQELVDAATNCLVANIDTPALRTLAGTGIDESPFVVEPLVMQTVNELGMSFLMTGLPERGALEAMLRRLISGRLSARELSSWAHRVITHEGPDDCQPFVSLDDVYDEWEAAGRDLDKLADLAKVEAAEYLAGRPSPGLIGS